MNLDKASLDRYITTEPDNGYQQWYEKVFDLIPEDKISPDQYDKYMDFFDDGMNELALAGANGGFPDPQFAADVVVSRFKYLLSHTDVKTWAEIQALKRVYIENESSNTKKE
jgi:hypothetical protein